MLGVLVNALILLRAGLTNERADVTAIGLLLLAAAGLMQVLALLRHRALLRAGPCIAVPASAMIGLAAVTALCSFGALLMVAMAV